MPASAMVNAWLRFSSRSDSCRSEVARKIKPVRSTTDMVAKKSTEMESCPDLGFMVGFMSVAAQVPDVDRVREEHRLRGMLRVHVGVDGDLHDAHVGDADRRCHGVLAARVVRVVIA